MVDVKVKLRLKGINIIMTSPGVTAEVIRRAWRMASAAGEGFEAVVNPHRHTARAFVRTADAVGRRRQAESAVLERSLDAGR